MLISISLRVDVERGLRILVSGLFVVNRGAADEYERGLFKLVSRLLALLFLIRDAVGENDECVGLLILTSNNLKTYSK